MNSPSRWNIGGPSNYERIRSEIETTKDKGISSSTKRRKGKDKTPWNDEKMLKRKSRTKGGSNQGAKNVDGESGSYLLSGVVEAFCSPTCSGIEVEDLTSPDLYNNDSLLDASLSGSLNGETIFEEDERKPTEKIRKKIIPPKQTFSEERTTVVHNVRKVQNVQNVEQAPKIKTDRPSIYEEAISMLAVSILVYTFADLQKMVTEGLIDSSGLTKYPITITQVLEAIRTNKVELEARASVEERLQALKDLQVEQEQPTSKMGRVLRGLSTKKGEPTLISFHDENSSQGMVYGIALNPTRRRVTVVFRGSVTVQDFITDVKFSQKMIPNPVAQLAPESPINIHIHSGFYSYLFQEDDDGKVRLNHILQDVKKLLRKNKGYRLYCTGHSLGGALATLVGFYASLDDQIVKNGPVAIYSTASPRVGNFWFRESFQILERLKRLQHLRISNKEDVVTLIPFVALKEASLAVSDLAPTNVISLYKHCGIHLKFKRTPSNNAEEEAPDRLFSITYAKDRNDEYEGVCPDELKRSVVAGKAMLSDVLVSTTDFKRLTHFHSCDEYERRLVACSGHFADITLDDLYCDGTIVGTVIATPLETEKKPSKSSRTMLPKLKSFKHFERGTAAKPDSETSNQKEKEMTIEAVEQKIIKSSMVLLEKLTKSLKSDQRGVYKAAEGGHHEKKMTRSVRFFPKHKTSAGFAV